MFLLAGVLLFLLGCAGAVGVHCGDLDSKYALGYGLMMIVGWFGMLIVAMSWAIY